MTGACRVLAQGNYTHRHSQVANIVHQGLAIRCGQSKVPPVPYHKYEQQSVLENSHYKLYCDRSMLIPVAMRSKEWVCGHSLTGIVGSNPAGGMDVCLL